MKNWDTLEADEDLILDKHYTSGRSGRSIDKVVLHHNAGNLSIKGCYDVWQTREASAHYQVDASGRIGQLVWDADTAWHAGTWDANCTSIGIEHADCSTSPWKISDATLDNGAHLTAAICKYYGLGEPTYGRNVFFHKDFQATSCPASIAGDQRDAYLTRAREWYRQMTGQGDVPTAPATPSAPAVETLDVDGMFGPKTARRYQQVVGTTPDGVISGQIRCAANENIYAAEWGEGGSDLIEATSAYFGITDLPRNAGPEWVRCFLVEMNGYVGNGVIDPVSDAVKELQRRLNAGYWHK